MKDKLGIEEMINLRKEGLTYRAIGEQSGISGERVRQLIRPFCIALPRKQREKYRRRGRRVELREQAIRILGGKCARCGFDDIRALQIDHINGDGKSERDTIRSYGIYSYIAQGNPVKGKYQLLCANCNWIKRAEDAERKGWGRRD